MRMLVTIIEAPYKNETTAERKFSSLNMLKSHAWIHILLKFNTLVYHGHPINAEVLSVPTDIN